MIGSLHGGSDTVLRQAQDTICLSRVEGHRRFDVHLDNFEGPFDLLLQLISRHKLDITEVALSQVTDDFIGHIKAAGSAWDLDQTSQFIVVAATLAGSQGGAADPVG